MKKIILVLIIIILAVGCARGNRNLPPEAEQYIKSVDDVSKCKFIKDAYLESRPSVQTYYLKLNVYNAGGDSYKITSSTQQMMMGAMVNLINFEIYKCK